MIEKLFSKKKEWDVVALGIRDANGIQVVGRVYGTLYAFPYQDFLSLPCVQATSVIKLISKEPKIG